jgi:hypothetical protein
VLNIVIAGGTGFIGTALAEKLVASNHSVVVLTREPQRTAALSERKQSVQWDAKTVGPWVEALATTDAVVNLVGENIGGKRWSVTQKKELAQSRMQSTALLIQGMRGMKKRPSVFVNASAVGYYGNVPAGEVPEEHPPGSDFLAQLCVQWEREAMKAAALGLRVVTIRSGIILSKEGGALPKMLFPFRLFVGGPLGTGKQWFPWIHLDDEIRAIQFALESNSLNGAVNLTTPNPVTMREFCQALGKAMHRPWWTPVPGFVLKAVLGEMAGPLLLGGQRAVPKKLLAAGFQFRFNKVEEALLELLG